MKKTLFAIFAGIVCILALSACNVSVTTNQNSEVDNTEPLGFTNFKYRFNLLVPRTWDGFSTISREKDLEDENLVENISFQMDGAEVFHFNVYNKADFETLFANNTVSGEKFQENEEFVFTYTVTGETLPENQKTMIDDVNFILESFELF